ncbi:hypothetical protein MAR_003583, partial [Mya arenaria]
KTRPVSIKPVMKSKRRSASVQKDRRKPSCSGKKKEMKTRSRSTRNLTRLTPTSRSALAQAKLPKKHSFTKSLGNKKTRPVSIKPVMKSKRRSASVQKDRRKSSCSGKKKEMKTRSRSTRNLTRLTPTSRSALAQAKLPKKHSFTKSLGNKKTRPVSIKPVMKLKGRS